MQLKIFGDKDLGQLVPAWSRIPLKGGELLKISKHAVQRWVERVDPGATNKDKVEVAIREAFGKAELIYQKRGDEPADFWLSNDGVIFVVVDGQVVTLYKAEYGFDPEIDQRICRELRQALGKAKTRLANAEDIAGRYALELRTQIDAIEAERRQLEARFQVLQSKENKLREHQTMLEREVEARRREVEGYAQKLVYSVAYRLEWAGQNIQRMTG